MTTRGLKEDDFVYLVELMDRVITNSDNEDVIASVRSEVRELCKRFPLYEMTTLA